MSEPAALPVAPISPRRTQIFAIVGDGITGLFVAATIILLIVGLAASFLDGPALIWLGIWAGIASLFSLPAMAVLHLSKPRIPLKQRSALIASASWFGRVLWSAFLFSASVAIGSVAGIMTSSIEGNGTGADPGAVLMSLGTTILWPIILGAGAVAYIVMGVRWSLDLGSIVADDRGAVVRALLESRWTGPLPESSLFDILIEVGLTFVSRIALILTLITIALSFGLAVSSWA